MKQHNATSCNNWNILQCVFIEDLRYVEKKLCTLFYRHFHLSVLLWKQSAMRIYTYLMGDPFRVFITDLEKGPTARTAQPLYTSTLFVILNILQNCTVHIL